MFSFLFISCKSWEGFERETLWGRNVLRAVLLGSHFGVVVRATFILTWLLTIKHKYDAGDFFFLDYKLLPFFQQKFTSCAITKPVHNIFLESSVYDLVFLKKNCVTKSHGGISKLCWDAISTVNLNSCVYNLCWDFWVAVCYLRLYYCRVTFSSALVALPH